MAGSDHHPRRIRRREALVGLGAAGAGGAFALWKATSGNGADLAEKAASTAARADQCVLQPELTEGPYDVDGAVFRKNITEGKPGERLDLEFVVQDAESCEPIRNATVEIWHADAEGAYSTFNAPGDFLRGQQKSDEKGRAEFRTVFPGWYTGRTPHIHLKVHLNGNTVHTGQVFFEDDEAAKVYRTGVYADRGTQDTTNAADGIYGQSQGRSTLALKRRRNKKGKRVDGYEAKLNLGVSRA